MTATAPNPWIEHRIPKANAALRLFCFHHAGGAASAFRPWSAQLPTIEVCPIQLPGRWTRIQEPAFRNIDSLLEALHRALAPDLNRPFAFFGHSLGSLIAFEFARALRKKGGPLPVHLVVAARRPPQMAVEMPLIHKLPDRELVEAVQSRYNGIHPQVAAEPELLALLLPTLRADLTIHETYQYSPEPPLPCPITAFGGERDRAVTGDQLEGWSIHTSSRFQRRMFPGDHFFTQSLEADVLSALSAALSS